MWAAVLDWISKKVAAVVGFFVHKKKVTAESNDSVQPLKDAKTKEEIDAATDDALNHF